jgi:hypothetical protein
MRLSWYADTGVAVFSIWQGGRCTGTFRLPIEDLPRMIDILERGPQGRGRSRNDHAEQPDRGGSETGHSGHRDFRTGAVWQPDADGAYADAAYADEPRSGYGRDESAETVAASIPLDAQKGPRGARRDRDDRLTDAAGTGSRRARSDPYGPSEPSRGQNHAYGEETAYGRDADRGSASDLGGAEDTAYGRERGYRDEPGYAPDSGYGPGSEYEADRGYGREPGYDQERGYGDAPPAYGEDLAYRRDDAYGAYGPAGDGYGQQGGAYGQHDGGYDRDRRYGGDDFGDGTYPGQSSEGRSPLGADDGMAGGGDGYGERFVPPYVRTTPGEYGNDIPGRAAELPTGQRRAAYRDEESGGRSGTDDYQDPSWASSGYSDEPRYRLPDPPGGAPDEQGGPYSADWHGR